MRGPAEPHNLIPIDRERSYLMPPCLRDSFMLDAMGRTDFTAFDARYRADGWARRFPMMVTLLSWAYCTGVRSSQRIEHACGTDVAFRVIAGNTKPDNATVARSGQEHLAEPEGLFVQVLRLRATAGIMKSTLMP